MPPWADRQRGFAAALLAPKPAVPPGLVGPDGEPSPKRFAVYRNNVVVGLIEALQTSFPATRRIVGVEFFRVMAREYVTSQPPTSPILLDYGAEFPNFMAGFEPAATLPYLPDVARIERAWIEAFHAREAVALAATGFAAVPSEWVAEIHLALHASLRIVRSQFPALTIWRMNVADGVPMPVDLAAGGEDALVVRPDAEVEVRAMPGGAAEFVAALADRQSLTQATQEAIAAEARFDLTSTLTALISAGVFIGYSFADGTGNGVICGEIGV